MLPASTISRFRNAAPFGISIALPILVIVAVTQGGWFLILPPLVLSFTSFDFVELF